jgi:hypothetical protein
VAEVAELLGEYRLVTMTGLDRIRDKTGCRRAGLTRLALSAGLI